MNRTSVDSYLADGCGRCERYRTARCKVRRWTPILVALRALVRDAGLVEAMKWGQPCYTLDGKNVVMLASLETHCALSFFDGAALDDEDGLLKKPGPNTRRGRVIELRSLDELEARRAAIERLVRRAVEAKRAGVTVELDPAPEAVPAELEARLAADAELRRAFGALTPGRRRSHVLHVRGAKRSETRARRVEKCAPKILAGKGFNER